MKQFVGNNRVEHAHTAFVENAHDGFALLELPSKSASGILIRRRQLDAREIAHVALIVSEHTGVEPLTETLLKKAVGEVLAPERTVADARLGHRAVEIQHADQPRPGAAPIGHGQDGAAMCEQSGQDMVAVLPDRFGDN